MSIEKITNDKIRWIWDPNHKIAYEHSLDKIGLLADTENRAAQHWAWKHKCKKGKQKKIRIKIEPTGIGNGVVIKCKTCKKKKDITDVSTW